jgi:hypothetical protein
LQNNDAHPICLYMLYKRSISCYSLDTIFLRF